MRAKVSVIIPCYNQGMFLAEAIQSIIDQDYSDKEIIVVDDGSTDNTRDVVLRFKDKIMYIRQDNKGVARARNIGIQASSGDYIAFLDADDVALPGRLKLEAEILDQFPEVGLVASDAYLINEMGHPIALKSSVSGAPRNHRDF
ncbi:MAG: glycosyltransferase family A protein, partial [Anaerolineae bacterium]